MKIKTRIVALSFLTGVTLSCSQKHTLEVNISEIGKDTIYVESYKISNIEEDPIMDTIYSVNGKFTYDLPTKEPIISIITPKKAEFTRLDKSVYRPSQKSILLFLRPEDKISVKGKLEKFNLDYQAKGSGINEVYSEIRRKYTTSEIEKTKIELKIDTLVFNNGNKEEINALFKKRKEISNIASKIQLNYVIKNWDEDLAAFYLTRQPLDTLGKYIENLNESIKSGFFQSLLQYHYTRFQKYTKVREADLKIKIGEKAPEFRLKSNNGNDFTLNSSKHEFTVLDFWGSWCAPCIEGFPKMKKYFGKYESRIEFIGIACNDTEEKWKTAIENYELKWRNLINNNEIDKDVSVMYAVKAYPTKIIINSSGIIEGIFNGEGEDFYNRLDELMEN